MTQEKRIMQHLNAFGSITAKEAMELYGIMRLGARIYDLKEDGVNITRVMDEGVNRYGETVRFARYKLGGK